MLQQIYLRDFILVKEATLDVGQGMCVITGETGAGKSLLLDAIQLCLGDRATASMVRLGQPQAEIVASFDITGNQAATSWMTEHDFENEGQCVLRRLIYENGRSRLFLQGRPISLQEGIELGHSLVHYQGQHHYQHLLKSPAQRSLLDAYGQISTPLHQTQQAYHAWAALKKKKDELLEQSQTRHHSMELLKYQVDELTQFRLQEKEWDELNSTHKRLANYQQTQGQCVEILELLSQDERGIMSQLYKLSPQLQKLALNMPGLAAWPKQIQEVIAVLEELSSALSKIDSESSFDEALYKKTEQRLGKFFDLARKHQQLPQDLYAHYCSLKSRLDELTHLQEAIENIDAELLAALTTYQQAAAILSQARQEAGADLSREISQAMQVLGLEGGRFEVGLELQDTPASMGQDIVHFLVATNPGQSPQPLGKIASGGELSRLSLALQLKAQGALSQGVTLIFDEVDVGISGQTGEKIANALYTLSQKSQVFCITHMAQVAAKGDHHLYVSKQQENEQATTRFEWLKDSQRIVEIARLLGSTATTQSSATTHAKSLLGSQKTLVPI